MKHQCISLLLAEALKSVVTTVVAIATTSIVAGVIWLATMGYHSRVLKRLLQNKDRTFQFHYRGEEERLAVNKIVFSPDYSIEVPTEHERRWEIKWGKLYIYNRQGKLYSCFRWDKVKGKLVHTNDPKLPSPMGQYIVPSFTKASENKN